ncbi:hypothetical protein TNCV_758201 [Trichonephila clavipes]|nr:hypothetical protein TNCV_758201 [Trichonephila clavipes]
MGRGWNITRSCPGLVKSRRVGERCTLNLWRAQTSSFRCGPHHLTMVQNYELPRVAGKCDLNIHSLAHSLPQGHGLVVDSS